MPNGKGQKEKASSFRPSTIYIQRTLIVTICAMSWEMVRIYWYRAAILSISVTMVRLMESNICSPVRLKLNFSLPISPVGLNADARHQMAVSWRAIPPSRRNPCSSTLQNRNRYSVLPVFSALIIFLPSSSDWRSRACARALPACSMEHLALERPRLSYR